MRLGLDRQRAMPPKRDALRILDRLSHLASNANSLLRCFSLGISGAPLQDLLDLLAIFRNAIVFISNEHHDPDTSPD